MKTFWVFINLQIIAWAAGMTLAERYLEIPYPRAAYMTAAGCIAAGFILFLWISPKIESLTSTTWLSGLLVFAGGFFYLPVVAQLLKVKWQIP